jgi:hypothetical protein
MHSFADDIIKESKRCCGGNLRLSYDCTSISRPELENHVLEVPVSQLDVSYIMRHSNVALSTHTGLRLCVRPWQSPSV